MIAVNTLSPLSLIRWSQRSFVSVVVDDAPETLPPPLPPPTATSSTHLPSMTNSTRSHTRHRSSAPWTLASSSPYAGAYWSRKDVELVSRETAMRDDLP